MKTDTRKNEKHMHIVLGAEGSFDCKSRAGLPKTGTIYIYKEWKIMFRHNYQFKKKYTPKKRGKEGQF